jgi:hypothetical protein
VRVASAQAWSAVLLSVGGTPENRRIPLDGSPRIILTSCHCFCATSDLKPLNEFDLLEWLPRPSQAVREKVRLFKAQALPARGIVGLHMRRTDNDTALMQSPDWLFFRRARAIVDAGGSIYLATDNRRAERKMLARFGESVVIYPKNPKLMRRWPRTFSLEETIEDYADLLLLASCDYVFGSAGSSYSRLAMVLNGSPRCAALEPGLAELAEMTTADKTQAGLHEVRKLLLRLRQSGRRMYPGIGIGRSLHAIRDGLRRRR